jgi:hypothetical protein
MTGTDESGTRVRAEDLAWYAVHMKHRDPAGDAEATRIERTYSFDELAAAGQDPDQALESLAAARIAEGWDPDGPGLRDT